VQESDGSVTVFVTLSAPSSGPITVGYATSGGTAVAGTDYTPNTSGVVTFDPLVTRQQFTVPIIDKGDFSNQTVAFSITLTSTTGWVVIGNPSTTTITISDNDAVPTFQFASDTYGVNENAGTMPITVTLSRSLPYPVSVTYATKDNTAFAGTDYMAASAPLAFPAYSTSQSFDVGIIDKGDVSGQTVNFSVQLSNPSDSLGVGSPSTTVGTITDNDTDSDLLITSLSPSDVLVLGTDLTVHYQIPNGLLLTNVRLRVTNNAGELVFQGNGLPAAPGNHTTKWQKGKWNQAPHAGALANPKNGPYSVQIVADCSTVSSSGTVTSNIVQIQTLLVLEADLEDDRPSMDEISSGLYRPALDPDSPERLRIGLVPTGSGVAAAVYALAAPAFSNIVEEDLDNDPSDGLEVKSAHFRQEMQSTFNDGVYKVVISGLRDQAGNLGAAGTGPDGIFHTWTITLY
jgi:hypothetical protein